MTEKKSRIVIDGHGIKPSTPPPVPTFGRPIRVAGEKPSPPQPKPPTGQKRD